MNLYDNRSHGRYPAPPVAAAKSPLSEWTALILSLVFVSVFCVSLHDGWVEERRAAWERETRARLAAEWSAYRDQIEHRCRNRSIRSNPFADPRGFLPIHQAGGKPL